MLDWAAHLRPRLARLALSPEREVEIIEELSEHLDLRYSDLLGEGVSEPEARRRTLEELLAPDALSNYMESLRQAHARPPATPGIPSRFSIAEIGQDLRYASRTLRKQPGFAAAAILTMALGIGANSAIFALVDATLLRPLPFHDPERLVMLWERTAASRREPVSPLNLLDWNQRSRTFEKIAGFIPNVGSMVLSRNGGATETVSRQWVTADLFAVLGVKPIAGRTFLPSDDRPGSNVVVVNETFWRAHFNADPDLVGREIRLDGSPYTVAGILPEDFQLLGGTSVWALMPIQNAPAEARGGYALQAVGRTKPGVTLANAAADLASVAQGLAQEFPATNKGRGITMEPMRDAVIGSEVRLTSMLFLGVVGFALLLCCANVANLLLARATARSRELAIRAALGASRARVIRQLLTESLLLSTIGGAIGLAIGAAILNIAPALIPAGLLPPAVTFAFDLRVVSFCTVITFSAGLFFGLIPALQVTRISSAQAIASGERTTAGRGGQLRELLVVGEVAIAVVLLTGGGLLLRTLLAVENADRGYRAESILTMMVDPLDARHPTPESLLQFYQAIEQEVTAVPGVRSVAWASTLPLGPSYAGKSFFEIVGEASPDGGQKATADYQIVSPRYFPTLDLAVLAGRAFDDRDRSDGVPVCLVNEALVRNHLHGRSPIGLRLAIRGTSSEHEPPVVREIAGVVRQVKGRPDETEDLVQIYVPLGQHPVGDIFMAVRPASGDAKALVPGVRAAVARVDKEQLVSIKDVMTLEDVAREATARHRFRAALVVSFAGLALLLAMVGLFGMLAYSVQQRIRDFGLRRALGATTGDVLRLVVRSAVSMIVAGVLIGLVVSMLLGRLLATVLFGVEPWDPITLASVTGVLSLTAIVSIAGPAWRATRVDPSVALRQQ